MVAVGRAGAEPAAWRREGGTWVSAPLPGVGAGRSVAAVTVTPSSGMSGRRFVAVGRQIGLGDVSTPLAWTSEAAGEWRVVPVTSDGDSELADVLVTSASRVVALGNATARKRITPVVLELNGPVFSPTKG